jgi:hypothetical protein
VDLAETAPAFRVDVEDLVELAENLLEVSRLEAVGRHSGIAVHRVAAPEHRFSCGSDGVDQGRENGPDARIAETVDQGEAAQLIVRISCSRSTTV